MINRIYLLLLLAFLLVSCSNPKKPVYHEEWVKDTNGFDILMGQFAHNIETIWGMDEVLIAGPKDYVKYSDGYYTRSHINFDSGKITIETISGTDPIASLRQAIITTLLIGENPGNVDLYSDANDINISQRPLLYGQVVDHTGQPIRWQGSAATYANYLLNNQLTKRVSGMHVIWSVNIAMVPNHLDKRAHRFLPLVRKAAQLYGVDTSLILAIMQTESSFNPYAVSHNDALGLMQVVQETAGRDVFRLKGKWGKPSRRYLLDPAHNIDAGTAYLSLLQKNYLAGISDPLSLHYAVITAYNGGAGSVLRVFAAKKDRALRIINQMPPAAVYQTLIKNHPATESRNYLYKVIRAQRSYNRY